MHFLPCRHIFLTIAIALALVAGLLLVLPKTHGSPAGASRSSAPDAFLNYHFSLNADDYTTYTHPVYGFSFPYPKDDVLSTVVTDDGETVRATSPRFTARIEVTYLGVVAATNADEDSLPLIIRRLHPTLGKVADARFTDGQDAYHVRMYAPHGEWVNGAIRALVYSRFAPSRPLLVTIERIAPGVPEDDNLIQKFELFR